VRDDSIMFNRNTFGNIFRRMRRLEQRFYGIQKSLECSPSDALASLKRSLQTEYNRVLHQEELSWYQNSRDKWVKYRDKNTKFFHTLMTVSKKKNCVHGFYLPNGE